MKKITDAGRIDDWVEREKIQDYFDTKDLEFQANEYEKGEFITSPYISPGQVLFLVEGVVQIYSLRNDGGISPISQTTKLALLGDMEFCTQEPSPFFVEAKTRVVCLTLSIDKYREELNRDLRFLHALLQSFLNKLKIFSSINVVALTIEERVLLYMKTLSPNGELQGIETATVQLRCSRRQLQRVLKKLCDEGEVEKIGKGHYRLAQI